jgi:acyl-CoA dehydrogenase
MISFQLSDEQEQLGRLAREFALAEMRPQAPHHDQSGEYPMDIVRKAWEIGLMNTHLPTSVGGPGLGTLEGCLIVEQLGYGCCGMATAMEANTLAAAPVIVGGTEELKRKWLAPLVAEPLLAAYCVTEPGTGSDVAAIATTAVRKGDEYVLNGSKMWITNGSVAHWYFVLARTDASKGIQGMSGFVVPRNAKGVSVGKKEQNMGQRCSDTRSVTFQDVRVPVSDRVGAEGQGWLCAMKAFDHTRPTVAAMAVGLSQAALDYSLAYAQERQAFGKPIAKHQAIGFLLADMARDIEAARLLTWKAGWIIDQGRANTREAAIAKVFAADTAMRVATDAVQIYGGYGYSREYPVEKLMRDAKVFQIYEGTSQIQRIVIARELLA